MSMEMVFDHSNYIVREMQVQKEQLRYRAYENIVYVSKPVSAPHQSLNVYVPECYYEGGAINGYTIDTAPIFFPNAVGGYSPAKPMKPEIKKDGTENIVLQALARGYVVISAGARGRGMKNENGENIGVAPACIVDLKAAVRYIKWNKNYIPGDVNKIISNGTSAGGALSALLGSTGNHPDFEDYLSEIGCAPAEDNIFAASCYCPITNLENADKSYEWEFLGINEGHWWHGDFSLSDEQIKMSEELRNLFPIYLSSLELKDLAQGNVNDEAALKRYILSYVKTSLQKAIDSGIDIPEYDWVVTKGDKESGKKVISIDWNGYIKFRTRMKPVPAFDSITMGTPENELFGNLLNDNRHFTPFAMMHSKEAMEHAEKTKEKEFYAGEMQIKMMNPMHYIKDSQAIKAGFFRIRHGAIDRDTSLAISAILTLVLQMENVEVDYFLPWGIPHAGDYDPDELFMWIEKICKA